eukprot:CAMPEP_0180383622 /NCGR_PEP_ID=MMETSP0989-20121125/28060_1 /TAXON_ID=697907 /ORGANISM="non described non described, Strain CCMP2293" /LENGTH=108 /DNA_ID=CAMNT_0022383943 /DNA_START=713 /DNA_END=1039 /DNA_ORIENTATION=-
MGPSSRAPLPVEGHILDRRHDGAAAAGEVPANPIEGVSGSGSPSCSLDCDVRKTRRRRAALDPVPLEALADPGEAPPGVSAACSVSSSVSSGSGPRRGWGCLSWHGNL